MDLFYSPMSGGSWFKVATIAGAAGQLELAQNSHSSAKEFASILGAEISWLPSNYLKMVEFITPGPEGSAYLLPKTVLRDHLTRESKKINGLLAVRENAQYLQNWLLIRAFLDSLQQPIVNREAVEALMEGTDGTKLSSLRSFLPISGTLAPSITYSTAATVTGRLTVKEGPRVLTSIAEIRSCFKSSFPDGKIVQLDLTSVEPRVALHVLGRTPSADLYQDFADELNIERDVAKLAILTALYGGALSRVASNLPAGASAQTLMRKVRTKLGKTELISKLEADLKTGPIRNIFGRPLLHSKDKRILLNHFLQSSAAELSIIAFSTICGIFSNIKPLYVIHDALILDVQTDDLEALKQAGTNYSYQGTKFPMTLEILSG